MEVTILPPLWAQGRDDAITHQVAIEDQPAHPSAQLHFAVRFANHRGDRRERVVGARVEFKKRRLWLWRKTITSIQVWERTQRQSGGPPITDLAIEPMAAPVEAQCIAEGDFDSDMLRAFPRLFDARLVLDMLGPIRRLERQIMDFKRPGASLWDRLKPGW